MYIYIQIIQIRLQQFQAQIIKHLTIMSSDLFFGNKNPALHVES